MNLSLYVADKAKAYFWLEQEERKLIFESVSKFSFTTTFLALRPGPAHHRCLTKTFMCRHLRSYEDQSAIGSRYEKKVYQKLEDMLSSTGCLSLMLNVGDKKCFRLWNICIYKMRYLGDQTQVKHKIHVRFIHTLQTQAENSILQYFQCPCILTTAYHMRSDMTFSPMSVFSKFWILKHFNIWISDIR